MKYCAGSDGQKSSPKRYWPMISATKNFHCTEPSHENLPRISTLFSDLSIPFSNDLTTFSSDQVTNLDPLIFIRTGPDP